VPYAVSLAGQTLQTVGMLLALVGASLEIDDGDKIHNYADLWAHRALSIGLVFVAGGCLVSSGIMLWVRAQFPDLYGKAQKTDMAYNAAFIIGTPGVSWQLYDSACKSYCGVVLFIFVMLLVFNGNDGIAYNIVFIIGTPGVSWQLYDSACNLHCFVV
jgi:hypothetical protein